MTKDIEAPPGHPRRYRIGDTGTMAAQLGHLLSEMALSPISLGVIPFTVERTVWPMATFTVFDDQSVHADSLDAAATLTQPGQVGLYLRAFRGLSQAAVYGAGARGLITQALTALDR
ncbi:Scr1 family TA system antitoxin-like transcriptional regulator [Streptomyces sp. R41]|uniref:Scr1 family TA system antitoxin-like transcriptional regulator n=1 Tax=Streptomyces sp. R41 TaxID=3238632 RepID=A0AB39R565_9ACTN